MNEITPFVYLTDGLGKPCATTIPALIFRYRCCNHLFLKDYNTRKPRIGRMDPIENHDFYQCIRGLLYTQRLGGGRIQRPKSQQHGICKYYTLQIYCIFCQAITIGVLFRTLFFFVAGVSLDTESLYAYLTISVFINIGVAHLFSFQSYGGIFPFWDSLLAVMPHKFTGNLFRTKIVIHFITAVEICYTIVIYAASAYVILQAHLNPAYIRIAEPWTNTLSHTRISLAVTLVCALPACLSWHSAGAFFMTGTYYLRAGFKDLYETMADDSQIVTRLSMYKSQHLRLSKLTGNLDYILRGMIGTSIVIGTFDMCFLIFTLNSNNDITVLMGSIIILLVSVITLVITAFMSISINAWVCLFNLYFISIYSYILLISCSVYYI